MAQVVKVVVTVVSLIRRRDGVRAEGDTQAGTPDVVVELAQQLAAFVDCLLVIEAAQQRDDIRKRIGGR